MHDIAEEASTIVFDIISCLRSALDHGVFDASARLGCNPNPKQQSSFGETAQKAARKLDRNKAGVPMALHPGNNAIWELNQARDGKVHRILAPVAVATSAPQIGRFENRIGRMKSAETPTASWSSSLNEILLTVSLHFCALAPGLI